MRKNLLLIENSFDREQIIREILTQLDRRVAIDVARDFRAFVDKSNWKYNAISPDAVIVAHRPPDILAEPFVGLIRNHQRLAAAPLFVLHEWNRSNSVAPILSDVRLLEWSEKPSDLKAVLKAVLYPDLSVKDERNPQKETGRDRWQV